MSEEITQEAVGAPLERQVRPELERIAAVENGRFIKLFKACSGFSSTCFGCGYFDPRERAMYRCHVMGSCPAASLEKRVIQYVLHGPGA
jgi:hypothetical protein